MNRRVFLSLGALATVSMTKPIAALSVAAQLPG
jgi:hypothetical protein